MAITTAKNIKRPKDPLHYFDTTFIIDVSRSQYRQKRYGPQALYLDTNSQYADTLISSQLKNIRSYFPTEDIIICIGFEHKKVYNYISSLKIPNIRFIYNTAFDNQNECASLEISLYNITTSSASIITDIQHQSDFSKSLTLYDSLSTHLTISRNHPPNHAVFALLKNKNIQRLVFTKQEYYWTGSIFLNQKDIQQVLKMFTGQHPNWFIHEIINELLVDDTKIISVED